jgi:methane/ammonia monooxygenase subunit C
MKAGAATAARAESWVSWWTVGLSFVAITTVAMIARVYQQLYAWDYGMDSFSPEFQFYWMNWLYSEFAVEGVTAVVLWSWLWKSRDRNLDKLSPRDEVKRMFQFVVWLGVYVYIVYYAGSFFAEQDASWHQVTVRDTDFTPSHVILFYLTFPALIVFGVAGWIWARGRLPMYSKGFPLAYTIAVAGPFMVLPVVGLNEWGHTFWFMEELFSHPLHYGFVVFGWSALALGGVLIQGAQRMNELSRGGKPAAKEYV